MYLLHIVDADNIKLNLDKNLVDLKVGPLPDKLSDVLANVLTTSAVGKPAKMMTWSATLLMMARLKLINQKLNFYQN